MRITNLSNLLKMHAREGPYNSVAMARQAQSFKIITNQQIFHMRLALEEDTSQTEVVTYVPNTVDIGYSD